MIESQDITPAEKDGRYEFNIFYSEQELKCKVEKVQNKLHINLENGASANLQINNDGTVEQIDGTPLPASTIEYIKKNVLGHNA